MSQSNRLLPGMPFPNITLPTTDGAQIALSEKGWRAIFVIRGAHCGICQSFLGALEERRTAWENLGIEVVVVSADPLEKSREFMQKSGYHGWSAYGIGVPDMRALGIWMTGSDVSGLSYAHPEPGFFMVDPEGNIAAAEASTLAFARPDLEWLDRGFGFMIEKNIRPPMGRYGDVSRPLARAGETVLLTGATGYIGSVIAEKLLAAGYSVRGLTRSAEKAAILAEQGIDPVISNVQDSDLMAQSMNGVSAIVHTAAPSTPEPGTDMAQMVADAAGAIHLLADLAAANGVRLIVTSGTSLYGPTGGQTVDESAPLMVPPFAAPIVDAERAAVANGSTYILRSANVYGRHQSAPMRMLIEQIRQRGTGVIVAPTNRLSLVHVDDLADLYLALLEADAPPTVVNGVSAVLPWSDVMAAVAAVAGVAGEPELVAPDEAVGFVGPAMYMPIDMAVSGDLARQQLAWQPQAASFALDLAGDLVAV